jgi:hypothetical protein
MNYFLDTEFLEGTQTKRVCGIPYGKTPNTIDLISIGIVAEDGREYYAISKEFNLKEAWNRYQLKEIKPLVLSFSTIGGYPNGFYTHEKEYWIRDNVLLPIYREFISGDMRNRYDFSYSTMKWLLKNYGKPNEQIAEEIKKFTNNDVPVKTFGNSTIRLAKESELDLRRGYTTPEFYAYFADYDWVVFCWLFGRMIDLPKGFPMYCRDLKQMLDDKAQEQSDKLLDGSFKHCLNFIKTSENYPKQSNVHDALADAKWNFELYKFLKKMS